ncbi:MAG TPA: cytidylate kinase, partial [Candidatus Competibacteraceae bacterium]|nr:cytidylate kinase [Candidatus Competibacteraceae bacterium]
VGLAVLDSGGDPSDLNAAVAAAEALDLGAIDESRIRSSAAGLAASKVDAGNS